MADQKITQLTADTTPTTDDLVVTVNDPAGTPANRQVTVANLLSASTFPLGTVVQVVNARSTAVATGTTTIPLDDSIPQNTEGDEYITLAITPNSATNVLVISAVVFGSSSVANNLIVALFQDTTAGALAVATRNITNSTAAHSIPLGHTMTAGTTSSTTFKIRVGGSAAGTTTFNGISAGRLFGAITKSVIVITEYKA